MPINDPIVDQELKEIVDDIEYEDRAVVAAIIEATEAKAIANGTSSADDKDASPDRKLRTAEEVEEVLRAIPWWKTWLVCFVGFKRGSIMTGYRTLLGMSLQSLQQLTGANYLSVFFFNHFWKVADDVFLPCYSFYYGATIFQSVGIQDSYVTQIILGAVNFGCTFLGLYVMERVSPLPSPLKILFSSFHPTYSVRSSSSLDYWWNLAIRLAVRVCSCRNCSEPTDQPGHW